MLISFLDLPLLSSSPDRPRLIYTFSHKHIIDSLARLK
nr:MAG TPA: hypothetical protein [Caudoviricetes sp.]DAS81326.1 MAG TPA: hypothetical protein [Caudoviricetes sp.]